MRKTKTYAVWQAMLNRCRNPRQASYEDYGARGIGVCVRWLKFENFLGDMGEAPEGMSIERKDNDCGYEPKNCIWTTPLVQSNNRRNVHRIRYGGTTLTLRGWAEATGVTRGALYQRLRAGLPPEQILREYHPKDISARA